VHTVEIRDGERRHHVGVLADVHSAPRGVLWTAQVRGLAHQGTVRFGRDFLAASPSRGGDRGDDQSLDKRCR
jgi:hypothetical protein